MLGREEQGSYVVIADRLGPLCHSQEQGEVDYLTLCSRNKNTKLKRKEKERKEAKVC